MDRTQVLDMVRNNPGAIERAREQFEGVLSRSATDTEFRQQLLTDSRAALSSHFGREIPSSVNIAFVDSAPGVATMVLPDAVDTSAELSESELEAVAGGSWVTLGYIALGFAAAAIGDYLVDG